MLTLGVKDHSSLHTLGSAVGNVYTSKHELVSYLQQDTQSSPCGRLEAFVAGDRA